MAKYVIQALKFMRPQPEVALATVTSTLLGPEAKGWSAIADEDAGVVVVKARKPDSTGKTVAKSFRFPMTSIDWYIVTAAKAEDEPADPK